MHQVTDITYNTLLKGGILYETPADEESVYSCQNV